MKQLLPCEPPWCNRRLKFKVKAGNVQLVVCGRHAGQALGARLLDRGDDRIMPLKKH